MSKNPHGGISRKSASREWGSKARKRETTQRNLNNRATAEAVSEQMICPYCDGTGKSSAGGECGFCVKGVHTKWT